MQFLEGVRDAVPAFYEAVAANDLDTLRRMASSKVRLLLGPRAPIDGTSWPLVALSSRG